MYASLKRSFEPSGVASILHTVHEPAFVHIIKLRAHSFISNRNRWHFVLTQGKSAKVGCKAKPKKALASSVRLLGARQALWVQTVPVP